MQWILQNGFSSEHRWNEFVSILERQEYEFSLHSVEPFVGQIKPEPIVTQERVICIGSYSMRHVAKQMDWQPGVFDLYEQNFLRQKEKWGSYLLNFESTVSTVCKSQFSQEKMFIRPIHDSKYFSGRLFTQREFEEWKQLICEDKLPNQGSLKSSTEILVGRPQEIFSEFRF